MKAFFRFDSEYDVRFLPDSPAQEKDRLEMRTQIFNDGVTGRVKVSYIWDQVCVGTEELMIEGGNCGLSRCFLELKGKTGIHSVKVQITTDEGEVVYDDKEFTFEVREKSEPILDGGFVMLGPPNDRVCLDLFRDDLKKFTDKDWQHYISEVYNIGMEYIIINVSHQYLEIEKENLVAHYESKIYPKSDICSEDPIAAILEEAEKNGQKVFLGVGNNYAYIGTREELEEVYDRYCSYKAFYGWYLAGELSMDIQDDGSLSNWERFERMSQYAYELCPVKPILISPYGMPSEKYLDLLSQAEHIDIMMPQDWIGQCGFTFEESKVMHEKLYEICKASGKHFWANCESFNFTDEKEGNRYLVPRFRGGGMMGEEGFDRQLELVRPYSEKIMTFMLSGFFLPENFSPECGGELARKQYCDYVHYRNQILE